jgi:hypothetical protein
MLKNPFFRFPKTTRLAGIHDRSLTDVYFAFCVEEKQRNYRRKIAGEGMFRRTEGFFFYGMSGGKEIRKQRMGSSSLEFESFCLFCPVFWLTIERRAFIILSNLSAAE